MRIASRTTGESIIYEGHDVPRLRNGPDPKSVDQPRAYPSGRLTQNGMFHEVAQRFKAGHGAAERVIVYEKIRAGIWVYNGAFELLDSWQERSGRRQVFKFRLHLTNGPTYEAIPNPQLEHLRLIPSEVKRTVWKKGQGSLCDVRCHRQSSF